MGDIKLASAGDNIKLWNCNGYSLEQQFNPHNHNVSSICWAHDNGSLASASTSGDKIVLTYSNAANVSYELAVGEGQQCIAFSSSSRYIMGGGPNGIINVWDLKTHKLKKSYKEHKSGITCLEFNWNDTVIASSSESGEIILYNVVSGLPSRPLMMPKPQAVRQICYSHFKKSLLASCSESGAICLWDANKRQRLHMFTQSHTAPAMSIAFSPLNEMLLMSVGLDKRIVCYDVHNQQPVKTMTADSPLTSIDLMHDGATLAVGSTRGKIYIYDLRQGTVPITTLTAHKSSVQSLKFQCMGEQTARSAKSSSTAKKTSSSLNNNVIKPPTNGLLENTVVTVPDKNVHQSPSPGPLRDFNAKEGAGFEGEVYEIISPIRDPVTPGPVKASVEAMIESARLDGTGKSNHSYESAGDMFSPLNQGARSHPIGGSADVSPAYSASQPIATVHTNDRNVSKRNITKDERDMHLEGMGITSSQESPLDSSTGSSNGSTVHRAAMSPCRPMPSRQRTASAGSSGNNPPGILVTTPNGAAPSSREGEAAAAAAGSGVSAFQAAFVRSVVEDVVDELREQLRTDVLNLHMEMLKQFQRQQAEMQSLLQQYSVNGELMAEIERLREENKRLKKTF